MVSNKKLFRRTRFMMLFSLGKDHTIHISLSQIADSADLLLTLKDSQIDISKGEIIFPNTPENHLQLDLILGDRFPVSPHIYSDLAHILGERLYLSPKTIQAYSGYIKNFFIKHTKRYWEVSEEDLSEYIKDFIHRKNPANSTIHLVISALQFFFRDATGLYPSLHLERPKKEKILPEILNKDEVKKILHSTDNPKHRALLSLVYSSGLRVSEVVNLKLQDIDKQKKVLKVASKGKTMRTTILSEMGINSMAEYLKELGHPTYLFPGQDSIRPLSIRSAEKIFEAASRKAGIQKKVSIHSLRHAFAAHLLEEGSDIKYLQSLLGHKNLQTTQVYLTLANIPQEQNLLKTG